MTTTLKANALAAALVAAQSEFPPIPKDGTATVRGVSKSGKPYEYDYTYATLPTIFHKILPVLHAHGIALTQTSDGGNLITALRHESGEWLSSSLEMPSPRNLSPQDWGKSHSYFRRYEVNGILGIAPEDDTDAAGVDAPGESPPPSVGSDPPPPPDQKTGNFRAAVADLVSRGAAAIEKVENVSPKLALDEMQSKKLTVLGHEGYEHVDEITQSPARNAFHNALEETVKALEAKAGGDE